MTAKKSVFDKIYQHNEWQDAESKSGSGSNLVQTAVIRRKIPEIVKQYGIKTMLDAPCGDFYWMKEIREDLGGSLDHYYGGDIVMELTRENGQRYGDDKFSFLQLDIINDPLPRVDLVFCRDCLVHLSYPKILRALRQFKKSGSMYLLTTTFTDRPSNKDIVTGDWRPLNLSAFPFCFQPPIVLINEGCTENDGNYQDKCLGLWRLEDLNISKIMARLLIFRVWNRIRRVR
jgi:hypothetical protein